VIQVGSPFSNPLTEVSEKGCHMPLRVWGWRVGLRQTRCAVVSSDGALRMVVGAVESARASALSITEDHRDRSLGRIVLPTEEPVGVTAPTRCNHVARPTMPGCRLPSGPVQWSPL
jgi:hypothetical protein